MSDIACPRCGRPFPTADISLELGVALCRSCDQATDLRDLRAPPAVVDRPRPEKLTERQGPAGVEISYRWYSPIAFFLILFVIAWNSFLVMWFGSAWLFDGGGFGLFASLFALPHAAVGIGLTYFTLALFLNRTRVTVGNGRLSVAHGPLPWRGNVDVEVRGATGLRVVERVSSGTRNRGPSVSWDVQVGLDGVARPLVTGLDDVEVARWLAGRVARELGVGVELTS